MTRIKLANSLNSVINLFYIPGSFLGAFVSDWIGPKYCLALGVLLQGLVGFIMAGIYDHLNHPSAVGGFIVIFGYVTSSHGLGSFSNL